MRKTEIRSQLRLEVLEDRCLLSTAGSIIDKVFYFPIGDSSASKSNAVDHKTHSFDSEDSRLQANSSNLVNSSSSSLTSQQPSQPTQSSTSGSSFSGSDVMENSSNPTTTEASGDNNSTSSNPAMHDDAGEIGSGSDSSVGSSNSWTGTQDDSGDDNHSPTSGSVSSQSSSDDGHNPPVQQPPVSSGNKSSPPSSGGQDTGALKNPTGSDSTASSPKVPTSGSTGTETSPKNSQGEISEPLLAAHHVSTKEGNAISDDRGEAASILADNNASPTIAPTVESPLAQEQDAGSANLILRADDSSQLREAGSTISASSHNDKSMSFAYLNGNETILSAEEIAMNNALQTRGLGEDEGRTLDATSPLLADVVAALPSLEMDKLYSEIRGFMADLDNLGTTLTSTSDKLALPWWLLTALAAGSACEIARRQLYRRTLGALAGGINDPLISWLPE